MLGDSGDTSSVLMHHFDDRIKMEVVGDYSTMYAEDASKNAQQTVDDFKIYKMIQNTQVRCCIL